MVTLLVLCGAGLSVAWTQYEGVQRAGAEQVAPQSLPPVPSHASDPPDSEALPTDPPEPAEGIDGGAVQILQARLDDFIPRPRTVTGVADSDGDEQTSAQEGDPYFLGFAAGNHFPPAGERIDPAFTAQVQADYADGRPTQETYAFVMFQRRMTPERLAELEVMGARSLGFHPYYTQKVALPVEAIDLVAAHPAVRWIGVPRPWQKVHPDLAATLAAAPNAPIEIYINVFESDLGPASTSTPVGGLSETAPGGLVRVLPEGAAGTGVIVMSNGWQQSALEDLGVEVLEYADSVRAFRARVLPPLVEELTALDFVQFVERRVPTTLAHDESVPMLLSDYTRQYYDGSTNSVAVAGIVDSGYDLSHTDLANIWGVSWDFTGLGYWTDGCEHGSHVAGTVMGSGASTAAYTGNAPGLGRWGATGRLFIVRKYDDSCVSTGTPLSTICGIMNTAYTDGSGYTTPRPHVINNSWGSGPTSGGWIGSETEARTLDNEVYTNGQVWVFAAHNYGPGASTVSIQGSAKNVLTVGNVVDYDDGTVGDPGNLWTSSGRGPCGDGRWKPNIVAPGRWIRSVDANSGNGYSNKSGTSMASPHVTGILSQLMDHHGWMRYAPHRAASMAMATAITKDDQILTWPTDSHLDQYGTGRIEAYRLHYGSSDFGWSNWGFALSGTQWTYSDFTVGTGATRLIVCMTYNEPACSAGASQALVNDYDLWLDRDPIDPGGNTGEYYVQQSAVDNTEIRVVNFPTPGAWRWKVWPDSVTGGANISVTVSIIYGDTTPGGTLTVSASDIYIQPNEDVDITATAYNPNYVASAVFLDSTSSGDSLQASTVTLKDGITASLIGNQHGGRDLLLGDIVNTWSRSATWTTRWASEGWKTWQVNARSDNWVDRTATEWIAVDGTEPGLVTNLTSTTHTPFAWSNESNITFTWTGAVDGISGVDGYGEYMSLGSPGLPAAAKDLEEVTSFSTTLSSQTSPWYWNLRTVDNSGNWSSGYASVGGYYIDVTAPLGPSVLNSPSHTPGVLSCNGTVTMTWAAASDAHSGLQGYVGVWDHSAFTLPTSASNISSGTTSYTKYLGDGLWYFHLRARDIAGNLGTTVHAGPYSITQNPAKSFCTAKINSQGCTPTAFPSGTPSMSGGSFQVVATNVLNNKVGIMFWGLNSGAVPFQGGTKCVLAPTVRTPIQNSGGNPPPDDCSGKYSFTWTTAYMTSKGLSPGDTVYAQFWSRDPTAPWTTGLTDAVKFTVCQ
jgi:hypothetical protein